MQIITETDFGGEITDHPWAKAFHILSYKNGGFSCIPRQFFRNWLDEEAVEGSFYIGRCSGFGVGSIAKYDGEHQSLRVGRFVSGGLRIKLQLNGQHEMRSISTCLLAYAGAAHSHPAQPQYGDITIKNDVWIGDEVMILGGGTIENGCVIGARSLVPPNFKSEPYGIYGGSPARLIRFRFSEKVIEALLATEWWDMPLAWINANNSCFLVDLTGDTQQVLEMLATLKQRRSTPVADLTEPR